MQVKYRNIYWMAFFTVITFGIYYIYWSVKTKNEIKSLGADIPTAFLTIVPLLNIYFWCKYTFGYEKYVTKDNNFPVYFLISILPLIKVTCESMSAKGTEVVITYAISSLFTYFLSIFIPMVFFQIGLNEFARKHHTT